MSDLLLLIYYGFLILIISFATGFMFGGFDLGKKFVAEELKQIVKFVRWVVKLVLQIIVDVCHWARNQL